MVKQYPALLAEIPSGKAETGCRSELQPRSNHRVQLLAWTPSRGKDPS